MQLSEHHAYLVRGRLGDTSPREFLKARGLVIPEGTIVTKATFGSLSIDDARELFRVQLRKTAEDGHTVICIEASFITREAGNALLKMLEEPSARTHFVLITPHPELLLPTLLSRFVIIGNTTAALASQGKEFLKGSYEERLAIVASFVEKGDRSGAEGMLREIVGLLHQKNMAKGSDAALIDRLERLRRYSTDTSSSLKMILEYITYALPA